MALGDIKTFDYNYTGLQLQINVIDNGDGTVKIVVKCISGAADVNALYWNDGVTDGNNFDLGTKKDNSLNMNGTGEDWDGGLKLSSTGLGSAGTAKSTYLTTGEEYVIEDFTLTGGLTFDTLDTLGVRATSTSTAEGSIKGVDGDPVITECPHIHVDDVTVAEEAGNAVFTVSIEEAYLYDVTISYTTANGTAGATDYTTTSGTVTILAGQTSATITVPILDDETPELTETFVVNLTGATAVLPGDDLSVTDCIQDNQGLGTITDTDVETPPPGNDPPAAAATAGSQGYWTGHDGSGPQANDWDIAQGTSFETEFGVVGRYAGQWDTTNPINGTAGLVNDITLRQSLNIPQGGPGENHLASEATTALLNLLDEDMSASFKEWYIYERANFVSADPQAANDLTGYTDAQILADLKLQVQDAFASAGDAYTMQELTDLLLLTHE